MRTALLIAALCTLVAGSASAQLAAYWNFNDNSDPAHTVDSVGGLVGTLNGGAAFSAGVRGTAGDYSLLLGQSEERNEHVMVDGSFLNSFSDQMTVSFWQKLDGTPNATSFFAVSPSSSPYDWGAQAHVPWSNGQVYFDTAGCCASGTQRLNGFVDVDFAEWNHFAFVKNGAIKEVFINGELALSGEGADPLPTDLTNFIIGNANAALIEAAGGGLSPTGQIDDFAIFNTGLDSSAVARLAAGESPTSVPEPAGFALLVCGALMTLRIRGRRS